MSFIDHVLEVPSYGWADSNGNLIKPTLKQLWAEAFSRINIFHSKRNWIPFINWFTAVCMVPFLYFYLAYYITWPLLLALTPPIWAWLLLSGLFQALYIWGLAEAYRRGELSTLYPLIRSSPLILLLLGSLLLGSAERIVQARQRGPLRNADEVKALLPEGVKLDDKRAAVGPRHFEVQGRLRLEDRVLEQRSLVERRGNEVVTLQRETLSPLPQAGR